MSQHKQNNVVFFVEVIYYAVCAAAFAFLGISGKVSDEIANIIYIIFIICSFGYLFSLEFVLKRIDSAVHSKAFARNYVPTGRKTDDKYKRKGIVSVIILWIVYLAFIALLKVSGVLNWYVFLIGACVMFSLNSVFVRKICLLSVLFLKNKNNCCKHCGINSWDYAIFASALIFAPELSVGATLVNWAIIAVSVLMMVIWEINYHKYPYRFHPETNKTLGCANCTKQCTYIRKEKAYRK